MSEDKKLALRLFCTLVVSFVVVLTMRIAGLFSAEAWQSNPIGNILVLLPAIATFAFMMWVIWSETACN